MDITQVDDQFSIESVQQQFADWRARCAKGEKIPQPLWQAAVWLCGDQSVSHVSRSLRLSFQGLKRRLPVTHPAKENAVRFMRLELGRLLAS